LRFAPNGEAAGIRGGDIVRFIPGSMVVRKDAQVIITVPIHMLPGPVVD